MVIEADFVETSHSFEMTRNVACRGMADAEQGEAQCRYILRFAVLLACFSSKEHLVETRKRMRHTLRFSYKILKIAKD